MKTTMTMTMINDKEDDDGDNNDDDDDKKKVWLCVRASDRSAILRKGRLMAL